MSLFKEPLVKNAGATVVGIDKYDQWIRDRWSGGQSAQKQGFAAYDALGRLISVLSATGQSREVKDALEKAVDAMTTRPTVSPIAVYGLAGEVGEVVELVKKHWRDGKHPGEKLLLELGDVLHYLTVIANAYGLRLTEVAQANQRKLHARDAKQAVKE